MATAPLKGGGEREAFLFLEMCALPFTLARLQTKSNTA
jgi:hypothetical protein